jgi:hypothetical protein
MDGVWMYVFLLRSTMTMKIKSQPEPPHLLYVCHVVLNREGWASDPRGRDVWEHGMDKRRGVMGETRCRNTVK